MSAALILPVALRAQVLEHALREAPREAVGLLGGIGGTASVALPLRNRAPGLHEFFADPYEQFQAERGLAGEGLEVVAIYHSHPDGGPRPSQADLAFAQVWPCFQLIVVPPLSRGDSVQWGVWRWAEGRLVECALHEA